MGKREILSLLVSLSLLHMTSSFDIQLENPTCWDSSQHPAGPDFVWDPVQPTSNSNSTVDPPSPGNASLSIRFYVPPRSVIDSSDVDASFGLEIVQARVGLVLLLNEEARPRDNLFFRVANGTTRLRTDFVSVGWNYLELAAVEERVLRLTDSRRNVWWNHTFGASVRVASDVRCQGLSCFINCTRDGPLIYPLFYPPGSRASRIPIVMTNGSASVTFYSEFRKPIVTFLAGGAIVFVCANNVSAFTSDKCGISVMKPGEDYELNLNISIFNKTEYKDTSDGVSFLLVTFGSNQAFTYLKTTYSEQGGDAIPLLLSPGKAPSQFWKYSMVVACIVFLCTLLSSVYIFTIYQHMKNKMISQWRMWETFADNADIRNPYQEGRKDEPVTVFYYTRGKETTYIYGYGEYEKPEGEYDRPEGEYERPGGEYERPEGEYDRPEGEYDSSSRPEGEYDRLPEEDSAGPSNVHEIPTKKPLTPSARKRV